MDKYATLTIFAIVCLSVGSISADESDVLDQKEYLEFKLTSSNDLETAKVENEKLAQFCLQSRDYVVNDIKNTADQLSSNVFTLIFDSAEAVVRSTMDVTQKGASRVAGQIANPSAPIEPATNEIEERIAETQASMAERNFATNFFEGIKSVVAAGAQSLAQTINERIERIKKAVNLQNLIQASSETCRKVEEYEKQMKADYAAFVAAPGNEELASIPYEKTGCYTTKRISMADGFCNFGKVSYGAYQKSRASAEA